jgi:hypothetical protein
VQASRCGDSAHPDNCSSHGLQAIRRELSFHLQSNQQLLAHQPKADLVERVLISEDLDRVSLTYAATPTGWPVAAYNEYFGLVEEDR